MCSGNAKSPDAFCIYTRLLCILVWCILPNLVHAHCARMCILGWDAKRTEHPGLMSDASCLSLCSDQRLMSATNQVLLFEIRSCLVRIIWVIRGQHIISCFQKLGPDMIEMPVSKQFSTRYRFFLLFASAIISSFQKDLRWLNYHPWIERW